MFERERPESAAGDLAVDYACVEPLAPGAVDPVRLAALVEGLDARYGLLDPAEFALVGPDPDVDPGVLFGVLDEADGSDRGLGGGARVVQGLVEPSVVVPARVPELEDMAPGPGLASTLAGVDLSALGAYELVEAVAGWQRIASWAAAGQADAVAELARRVEMRPVVSGRVIES